MSNIPFKNAIKKVLEILHLRKKYPGYFLSPLSQVIETTQIGKDVHIGDYVIIKCPYVSIGENSQVNYFCVMTGTEPIRIGKNVMIASHVTFSSSNHDYVQTKLPMRFAGNVTKGPIVVEDNVWIGSNVTITDGVTIGHDAVIGANSVVTNNVTPFDIVGGVPAKHIKNRND